MCIDGYVRVGGGYNRCECQRERIVRRIFELSRTPKEFYNFRDALGNQKVKTSLNQFTSYLDLIDNLTLDPEKVNELMKRNTTIVLKGNTGSGKTLMATTIALEIMKQFNLYAPNIETHRFFFLNAREIGNWMFDNEEKARIMNYVRKCNVLIIDDLGSEPDKNEYIYKALDELLRNFNGIKLITTNLNEELKDFYMKRNQRLTDVLVNTYEREHKKDNTLFYYVNKKDSRRRKSVADLDLI